MKTADNQRAMSTLPEVLKELDQITTADRQRLLVQGLMAGNLCDAGSMVAMDRHASLEGDFRRVRGEQSSIRWWRDDAAAWFAAWHAQPRKHVAAFVDNSGSDICLGVLPFVCWILRHGTNVTLVANEGPALNDITCGELRGVVKGLDALRHRTAETWGRLEIVSNSQACPLVDLGRLSAECVAHVADSDLIWLHGMGRAVESNWTAGFSCDVLRTAVLKEAAVASRVGGGLLDGVFRFDRTG
jgi:type II pantothenate kinase